MDAEEPLLSLGQAAKRLNVHPVTLRRWANNGDILVVLTPGGHRKFPKSEVDRLLNTSQPKVEETQTVPTVLEQTALSHTRAEIDGHRNESWMRSLDDASRDEQRVMGRRVMGLMMQYLSATDDTEDLLDEARAIGHTYAEMAKRTGLTMSQTMQALMFFRENIVESMILLPEVVQKRIDSSKQLLRKVNTFLNAILLGLTESYEA